MIITNLILFFNLILFEKDCFKKIGRICIPDLKLISLAGIFLLVFYSLGTFGLNIVTSINYSFISRGTLIFSIIFAYFFLNEKINLSKIFLTLLFGIGIYIISTEGKGIIIQSGDLIILIATLSFSSHNILQKKLCKNYNPNITSWAITLCGTLVIIFISILLKVKLFPQYDNTFLNIFFAGSTEALAVLFMNRTIYVSNVTYYSMMSMLVPVLSILLGVVFLNETISIIQIIGGAILIISGILVQRLQC